MNTWKKFFAASQTVGACEAFTDQATGFTGWRLRLDAGRAVPTPALSGESLFVGGGFGSFEFYCLNARTGARAWELRTKDDGPTAAVLSDGLAVFNTESCTLEVVEMVTGRVVWERWLGDPLLAQPAVMDGRVFMAYPKAGEHRLGCFSLRDGQPLWSTRIDHDVITAPVVAEGKVYFSTFDGTVWCLDPKTGKVDWSQQLQATSAPWIYQGDVFVAHREDAPQGARQSGDPARTQTAEALANEPEVPRERISRHDSGSGHIKSSWAAKSAAYLSSSSGAARKQFYDQIDSSVGFGNSPGSAKMHMAEKLIGEGHVSRAWRFQGSRPVVVNGILYDTAGDRLEASDARSGEVLWSWHDAAPTEGERRLTPPAVANGRVWAGTWDGRLMSWDALTGEVRWAVQVGGSCHWQPAVSDGWVYAGLENGSLVAFSTQDALDTDWPMWGGGPGHNGKPVPETRPKFQESVQVPPVRDDAVKSGLREPAAV
ncbi:MAG TPA: PQQ-binding-like beta-propeller repeat protein [Candidatus Limnocylindrales bacterium]|nr:PQQ-binding-like beta-propeller repeat protein [Candidatus Limnocylindrales bacterium]